MHPIRQLWRQKGKTVSGIVLVSLAVAILLVCLGQSMAARSAQAAIQEEFSTIGMITGRCKMVQDPQWGKMRLQEMNPEVAAFVDQMIAQRPDLIKGYSYTTLASAYIPQLHADHYGIYGSNLYGSGGVDNGVSTYVSVQDGATLVVRLTQVGEWTEYREENSYASHTDPETGETVLTPLNRFLGMEIQLQGVVEQVVALAQAQLDPTGWPITLTLRVPSLEAAQELDLQEGERYIVSGLYYFDNTVTVGRWINEQRELASLTLPPYHRDNLHVLTEEEQAHWRKDHTWDMYALYGDKSYIYEGLPYTISKWTGRKVIDSNKVMTFVLGDRHTMTEKIHTASMTLENAAVMPKYVGITEQLQTTREIYVDGEKTTVSLEEYNARYGTPTIAKLEGSVEDFLASNDFWRQGLENQNVNLHAFPVYCVDKLTYVPDFNRGLSRIVEGRDFTAQELESGERVCVVSEVLAQRNGLEVGQTILPQFYGYDRTLPYQYLPDSSGLHFTLSNPAYCYSGTVFQEDPQPYTIVGIYRKDNIWEDEYDNIYSSTPNAIFVPKQSVTAPTILCQEGLYKVLVLENGAILEFDTLLQNQNFSTVPKNAISLDGYDDLLVYSDQGYTLVENSMMDFLQLSKQVLWIGLGLYGILLLLYLLLFPLSLGKRLRTMARMGAPCGDKIRHVVLSSLGIFLPGTVLGTIAGIGLWGAVIGKMLQASGAAVPITVDIAQLLLIPAAQLLISTALVALLSLLLTRNQNLMKTK